MFNKRFFSGKFIFAFLLLVLTIIYYDSVLDKGPLNQHLWRQSDCLSIAQNYADGAEFFKPEMHIQLGDGNTTGYSAGEFPILYYTVGKVWSLFGKSHLLYRVFYLIILFAGLFALFRSFRLLIKSDFWAISLTVLLFTSPVFVVYGVSFLTDVPAFSFVLVAIYFFLLYQTKQLNRFLYLSLGFFTLAGLIKISSLIAFVILLCVLILESFSSKKTLIKRQLFQNKKLAWATFIALPLIIFSWYYYASYFNDLHQFKYTFNDIWPVWNMKTTEFSSLLKNIQNNTSIVFFSRPMLILLAVISIFNLFIIKKVPLFAYLTNLLVISGAILYAILWAPLLGIHDYYFVPFLIVYVASFGTFFWFLKHNTDWLKNKILKGVFTVFILYNFLYCLNVVKLKTLAQEGNFAIVTNEKFIGDMLWVNWQVGAYWNRYAEMGASLDEMGIAKNDLVISLSDDSFNTTLYLLERKGWTNFSQYSTSEEIKNLINKGAKYLFIADTIKSKKEFLSPFLNERIGDFKDVVVYKL